MENVAIDANLKNENLQKQKIGKIVNTFGLRGELKVLPQDPNAFKNLDEFIISGYDQIFKTEKISIKNDRFVKLKIYGYDDINLVTQFRNHDIFIFSQKENKLDENEYLVSDLIGCKIVFKGKAIGIITDVLNYGATDIFVFETPEKQEKQVPFVDDFFERIDVKNKLVNVTDNFFDGVV